MAWHRHTSLTNFIIQQSRTFEGVCVPLRLMNSNCLLFVPDSQPTATELFQSPEQSSAAYHICSVTSCLLLSLEDVYFFELCYPSLLLSCPQSDTVIYGHVNLSYLLTRRLSRGRGNYYRFEYFYPISSLLAYNQVITQLKSTCYCRP